MRLETMAELKRSALRTIIAECLDNIIAPRLFIVREQGPGTRCDKSVAMMYLTYKEKL